MKYRYENFGGIIASDHPPFLAFVDREYMRDCGLDGASYWQTPDSSVGTLSAPTEVHFACTNQCSAGCSYCYMNSGTDTSSELPLEAFCRALDCLADMGVFHVALGGGEALERKDLSLIIEHAVGLGLILNVTTNGMYVNPETARILNHYGQVNLSLDGAGSTSAVFRGTSNFNIVDLAADILLEMNIPTGINCVLGQDNYSTVEDLFIYGAEKGFNEIEFLRIKPSGRGQHAYETMKTTVEQNQNLYPMLEYLSERYKLPAKIDCSFIPMLCWHNPPPDLLRKMCTMGCEAGNMLAGITPDGKVSGCSFLPETDLTVSTLQENWYTNRYFREYREWPMHAPDPCASCDYLDICKDGCHAVSLHTDHSVNAPDPDCPLVVEYRK